VVIDSQIVSSRLSTIEQYLDRLERIRKEGSKACMADFDRRLIAERALHIAIEACIDISNHIISSRGYRKPQDYADVFKVLEENDVIESSLNNPLMDMARFRHRLVHLYSRLDNKVVFSILKENLQDIRDFAASVAELL